MYSSTKQTSHAEKCELYVLDIRLQQLTLALAVLARCGANLDELCNVKMLRNAKID